MSRPLPFTLPHAIAFWVVYVWAFAPEMTIVRKSRAAAGEPGSKDAGSLRIILIGMQVSITLSFVIAFFDIAQIGSPLRLPAFVIGTALLAAGSLLRRHCFRMLGDHFTGDVKAAADQPVVERGAYRWVRHPSYSAGIVMFLGIGFGLTSWASLAILLVGAAVVYAYRIRVEERALLDTIGEPYRDYMRRVPHRIVPFVF